MKDIKNFEIFIQREECRDVFAEISHKLELCVYRIDESDASTFVIHELSTKLRKVKSFNRLWELNEMREVIVVLASRLLGNILYHGRYYPLVARSQQMKLARRLFEEKMSFGGYWLSKSYTVPTPNDYWPYTFMGKKSLKQWGGGEILFGDPEARHFHPALGTTKGTLSENSYDRSHSD